MTPPIPISIFRLVHVDNLDTILQRGGMHGTNHVPKDGLPYRPIHNVDIQEERHVRQLPCRPDSTLHDYVPFYFGYLSPMLLQLKTNRVAGYTEGQEPLIYLVSTVQAVAASNCEFVFSNGHGIAAFTQWFDDIDHLGEVDWKMVYQRYWSDNVNDMDRQRRKQAEFMVYQFCPWTLIQEIGVVNNSTKAQVNAILNNYDKSLRRPVNVRGKWYY